MNFSISPGSGLLRQNVTARAKPRPLVPAASLLGGDSGQKPSSREQDARQSGPRLGVTPVASIDDAIKSMTDVRRALRRDVGRALDSITQFRPQAREALEGLLSERTAAVPRPAAPTESPAGATLTHATITLDAPLYESDRASEPTEQHDVPVFLVPRQAGPSSAPALAGEGPRSFVLSSASPSGRRALEDFTRTGSLVVAQNDSGFSVELTVTPVAAAQPREQGDVALFTPVGSFQGRSTRDELGNQTLVVDEAEVTAPIPGIPGGFVGVELEDAAFSRMTNESHGTVSVVAGIDVANTLGISAEQELFTFESGPRGAAQFAAASGSGPSQAGKLSLVSAGPTG
ncbi:hypothetical protein HOK31_28200, partial [Candidatus Poribacteria bacterium]|nr:hypothetical protein [Candidatus Poribacteria bacterium]